MLKKTLKYLFSGVLFRKIRFRFFVKRYSNDSNISDREYLTKLGKIVFGRKFSIDNPVTFNEKINWYKLNYKSPLSQEVVNKLTVKEYVKKKGLESILVKTLKVYNSVNEIDVSTLPNKFVIKNTCDSGGVFVCGEAHGKQS